VNYAETIDYLYQTLPLFSHSGSAAFKKDLTNTRELCARLGNPQNSFRSVHIGGTNGKGSVSHMLAAAFQSAGYKTGLYTSPHLYDFRERIRINGIMIPEAYVVSFVQKLRESFEEIQPSFFEATVAMAFSYFAEEQVDMAIIEVGLGGRLDSTNVITPVLSVITNIGWDHMNMLGDTLQAIASEKAGIIKPGVPVVIGERHPETEPVFRNKASETGSPIFFAEDRFELAGYRLIDNGIELEVRDKTGGALWQIASDLGGLYQKKNILTVLQAVHCLEGFNLGPTLPAAIAATKKRTGLGGRWEQVHSDPKVVLDVAHNVNGIEELLRHVSELSFDRLHLVMGMVRDKDVDAVLSLLPRDAQYYFSQAQIPRAMPAAELKLKASAHGLPGEDFSSVNEALAEAMKAASREDLIIVCGSIFLVAEVDRSVFQ